MPLTIRPLLILCALVMAPPAIAQQKPAPKPAFFTTPLSVDQMSGKQAVVETSKGTFIFELLPRAAPNHVGFFMKQAGDGAYAGTTFHRLIKYGIIQGGDPLSKDPSKRAQYGTGGLGVLKAEVTPQKHARGAVSAGLKPGKPDSAGAQFFVCVTEQAALDGRYTVFGRVNEGMDVVTKISEAAVDADGRVIDRVEIRSITIRDKPAPTPEPFSTETIAELASYRAVLETGVGAITIELAPDQAPNHVRNFLRLASAGVYDGTSFHRVAKGFVIQTGWTPTRTTPLSEKQQGTIRTSIAPELNAIRHVEGIVSMAHGDDPASASTSFFITTAAAPALDGQYSAFGKVVAGMDVVHAIESVPVDGEAPRARVDLIRVRVER